MIVPGNVTYMISAHLLYCIHTFPWLLKVPSFFFPAPLVHCCSNIFKHCSNIIAATWHTWTKLKLFDITFSSTFLLRSTKCGVRRVARLRNVMVAVPPPFLVGKSIKRLQRQRDDKTERKIGTKQLKGDS